MKTKAFQFEIIINTDNVLVSSFRFIWIPMLWVYGHYRYLYFFHHGQNKEKEEEEEEEEEEEKEDEEEDEEKVDEEEEYFNLLNNMGWLKSFTHRSRKKVIGMSPSI